MKQRIIFISLTTLFSTILFGLIYTNSSFFTPNKTSVIIEKSITQYETFDDFIYEIGPRFQPIKKSKIELLKSIDDIFVEEKLKSIYQLNSLGVVVIENDIETNKSAYSTTKEFSQKQLELLQSLEYSSNVMIKAEFLEKNTKSGIFEYNYNSPYLTIVPEQQAQYSKGIKALKIYLKEQTIEVRKGIHPEDFKPAKLYFTITEKGEIKNMQLDRSSNFPAVDKKMFELMNTLPGHWIPAKNTKGEPVAQELVVSFGLIGC